MILGLMVVKATCLTFLVSTTMCMDQVVAEGGVTGARAKVEQTQERVEDQEAVGFLIREAEEEDQMGQLMLTR